MIINQVLFDEIKEYCKYNGIEDVEKEINKMLRKGFNIEKYGTSPFPINNQNENIKISLEDKNIPNIKENIDKEKISENTDKQQVKPKRKIRIIKNN